MLEEVKCACCHSSNFQTIVEIPEDFELRSSLTPSIFRGPFTIVECRECGQFLQNPRPDSEYIHHYYPESYDCFSEWPPQNRIKKWMYNKKIQKKSRQIQKLLPSGGQVLDYGCGNGHMIRSLKKILPENYYFIGMDFSSTQVEKLKKDGIEAYEIASGINLENIFLTKPVQLIIINHVIEHVPNPYQLMSSFFKVLNNGGTIIGETPNADAWDRRIFKKYWAGWHAPRHFYVFDFRTIRLFAEKTGFEVTTIASDISGASHWAISITYLLLGRVFKNYKKNRLPLYLPMLILFVPVTIFQLLFSKTSIMQFQFIKKPANALGPIPSEHKTS